MRKPSAQRNVPRPKTNRSGVPITVYLDPGLNDRLSSTAKERLVGKSAIIRLAVERFLAQLESGQLTLPLGL